MLSAQSANQGQSQQRFPTPKDYEEHMTWRIRWFLIIAITIAYTLALIGGLIGFGVSKDPHYLLFITPTALIPFVRYLVPMDKKKYDLQLEKFHTQKELIEARLRVQMLEAELDKQQGKNSVLPATKNRGQLSKK
jgi:hypothetical protein